MKIAIIGIGLYGAYIANQLSKNKKLSLDLFEKRNKTLNSTAKKNQYRLHIGYHYPRSKETILQTIKGFKLFKKKFKNFLYFQKKNYYFIHKKSLINFKKYINVYKNFHLNFKKVNLINYSKYIDLKQIEGRIKTEEGNFNDN